jgi:DNA-binding MarR family transcriptional regulator
MFHATPEVGNHCGRHEALMVSPTAAATVAQGPGLRTTERPADLGRLITRLTATVAQASRVSLVPHDLSPLEYDILDRCHRGEANTVTELARALPGDASVVSRHVSKLVDRGLISRTRLSSDRRTVRLHLTADGRSLARALAAELQERQGLLMQGVSDAERRALARVVSKIHANSEGIRAAKREGSAVR